MKKLMKWCNWEMKNEFIASGYFVAMLFIYCIIQYIYGERQVDIVILVEMLFANYAISTLYKIFLDEEKDYSTKSFVKRAVVLCVVSTIIIVCASEFFGWFHGFPVWVSISTYALLVSSYAAVWILFKLSKKYDTQELNKQLANFKKQNSESNI